MNARFLAALMLQRLAGSRVGAKYAEFLRFSRVEHSVYLSECERRLGHLLAHARERIPFYHDRVPPGASLEEFPILTKNLLRDCFTQLMSTSLAAEYEHQPRGYTWTRVQTGGTTGSPSTVVHEAAFRDAGRASRLYSQLLCGFPFGTPYLLLWGSMRDINQMKDSVSKRVLARLSRQVPLNAFQMDNGKVDEYLQLLFSGRYRHAMVYVDSAVALARAALERALPRPSLESVMACAGTVTSDARETIHRAFGGRVHNKYGSRECTDMACECERGGFHIYAHHVHLEVVDEKGQQVAPGESGRILVTLLGNYSFPLIRYEIGDVGARAKKDHCDCGRPFPLMGAVEGRTLEALTSTSGSYVSPVYIRHLIGVVHNPDGAWKRFQVVQRSPVSFDAYFVPSGTVGCEMIQETLQKIQRDLLPILGADARIALHTVDGIPESESGKFLYVRNESRRN